MKKEAVAKICPACGAASNQYHRVPWSFHEKTSESERSWHYYRCPDCGAELPPDLVAEIKAAGMFDFRSAEGKVMTEKKRAAQRRNMAALNAAYTPEKRRLAAAKRKAKKAERE